MTHLPEIRPVAPQDLEALADMVRHLARFHGETPTVTPATLARDCLGQAPWLHALVAQRHGALCGYAMLCPRAEAQFGARGMDLHHLYVQRDLRRQGLGRALIAAAEDLARRLGARVLSVAAAPDNTGAGAAYLACGFDMAPMGTQRFLRRIGDAEQTGRAGLGD